MKKLKLLIILWLFAIPVFAQYTYVGGYVKDINTSLPIANHQVTVQSDSVSGAFVNVVVYTNFDGEYLATLPSSPGDSNRIIHVSTYDCQQYQHVYTYNYPPPNTIEGCDFWICSSPPACHADFAFQPMGPLTIQFLDQSSGQDSIRNWNFGDGYTSNLVNPVHTYAASGYYTVYLMIGAQGSACWDQIIKTVYVTDSIPETCQAYFVAQADNDTSQLVYFYNQSAGNINTLLWDFGDNNTAVTYIGNADIGHQYNYPGTYTVCLTVLSADTLCSDTYCSTVTVDSTLIQCQAGFAYSSVPGASPNTIQFINQSFSSDSITSWLWNFGDPAAGINNTSTLSNPIFTFSNPGSYTVCLTIAGNNCSSTYCQPVVIGEPQGCVADFEVLPAPNALSTFLFNDISTGNIHTWTWNFGDGTTQTVSTPGNPDVTHFYQSPGFYNVCLYIQGYDSLCSALKCETVAVGDTLQGCQAQFTYYPDSASSIPNVIQFVDLSSGSPSQWSWDFGDPGSGIANTSSLQNPVHSFTALGTYTVCLTISGAGCQSVWCGSITIGENTDCVNYFTFSQIGLSVNFEGHLLNNTGGVFLWDFGDNQTGTGESIIHSYNSPGTYFVTLTTTSGSTASCTYTSSQVISVGDTVLWSQLYGQVFEGNFPETQGMVFLFSLDTSGVFLPFINMSVLDSAGVYYFAMVPQGNYVIYAIPFSNGYLPTYYGNTLNWANATLVQLGTPNNPYNINLLQSNGFTAGNGTIGGQVSQGDFSGSMVDKVTMLLKDADGNTILYSQVDVSGNFNFPQLSYGTYYLYAELAGCNTEPVKVVISETSPDAEVMLTLSGNSILGTNEKWISLDAGVVFPNPVKEDAQITVSLTNASDLVVELYNMTGQLVYTKTKALNAGESIVLIPASQLMDGIYMLKITTREGMMLTRKLVKTK
jgi:PKD repeat protein